MTEAGKWYKFTVTIDKGTATKLSLYAQDNSESGATLSYKNFTQSGRYTIRFKALSSTSLVKVMTEGYTTGEYFWMDDVLIEEEMSGENGYRFGFNGKELDKEGMGGGGPTYDYGFRIYNAQLGKFLSVDPLTMEYPWYTPYQFAGNKPIWMFDIDGMEGGFCNIIPTQAWAMNGIRQPYNEIEARQWWNSFLLKFGEAYVSVCLFAFPAEELAIYGVAKMLGSSAAAVRVLRSAGLLDKASDINKAVNEHKEEFKRQKHLK